MKRTILHTAKILLLLFVLTAPVALVAGKNAMTSGRNGYHSSEAIKRIIHYNISTGNERIAGLARAEEAKAAAEAAISRLYGGIHYMAAIKNGMLEGEAIGKFISTKLKTRKGEGKSKRN